MHYSIGLYLSQYIIQIRSLQTNPEDKVPYLRGLIILEYLGIA